MAKYKNNKPSMLGLSFKGENNPRVISPGEVFEAEKEAIPAHYFEQGWIVEAKDADTKQQSATTSATADAKIDPKWEGPNPTQGSGTSVLKSETDQAAQRSGAYDNPTGHDDVSKRKK